MMWHTHSPTLYRVESTRECTLSSDSLLEYYSSLTNGLVRDGAISEHQIALLFFGHQDSSQYPLFHLFSLNSFASSFVSWFASSFIPSFASSFITFARSRQDRGIAALASETDGFRSNRKGSFFLCKIHPKIHGKIHDKMPPDSRLRFVTFFFFFCWSAGCYIQPVAIQFG